MYKNNAQKSNDLQRKKRLRKTMRETVHLNTTEPKITVS